MKRKIIKCLFAALLMLNTSCSIESTSSKATATQSTSKTSGKLKKEKGLLATSVKGTLIRDIYKLRITLDYYHRVALEDARKLTIYAAQAYLTDINENEQLKSLKNYPLTSNDIEITLSIYDSDKKKVPTGDIARVSLSNNSLTYELEPENGSEEYPVLKKETFDEALGSSKEMTPSPEIPLNSENKLYPERNIREPLIEESHKETNQIFRAE